MQYLDLDAHQRLNQGARAVNNTTPNGIIFEDVYDVVMQLFKTSY